MLWINQDIKEVVILKRNAIDQLIKWKIDPERKPMVLKGARQIGKTWIMKEFGKNYYDNYVYFNFDEDNDIKSIFEINKNPGRLNRIYNISKPEHPLAAFEMQEHFKLFVFYTGLLKHMAGLDNRAILLKCDYQFKGPLTENFVLQQLTGQFDIPPHYFSTKTAKLILLFSTAQISYRWR